MRNTVDENWQRLKRRLKDFWNRLIDDKRRPSFDAPSTETTATG
jgi:hypothetical protein